MLPSLSPSYFPSHRIGWVILVIWTLASALSINAVSYTPEVPHGFREHWRWRVLSPLNEFDLLAGDEGPDGTLYFASNKGVVTYDGYRCHEYLYPPALRDPQPQQIFASRNGLIYLLGSNGLLSFKDGEWDVVRTFKIQSSTRRNMMARNPFGTELIILPEGLFEIRGQDLVRVEQIPDHHRISSISFDSKNRLWIVDGGSDKILRYQFDRDGVKLPLEANIYEFESDISENLKLVASPESDYIWCINFLPYFPAHRFAEGTNTWVKEDLASEVGNNRHSDGFVLGGDEFLIFTKSGALLFRNGNWSTFQPPEFNVPSFHPFAVRMRNGDLILGGEGEDVVQIDLSANRYQSIKGLHFQCDGAVRKSWFISIGGDIIEHDRFNGTWERHAQNVIDTPLTLFKSTDGVIWAAGAHEGVAAVGYYDGEKWMRNQHPELMTFISHLSAKEFKNGDIYFGSGHDLPGGGPGGAVVYRKTNGSFSVEHHGPPMIPRRPVGFIQTSEGEIWSGGLQLYSINASHPRFQSEAIPVADVRWIDHILSDKKNRVWLALWDFGLLRFNNQEWEKFRYPGQLPSNQVVYIMEDSTDDDSIWVGTNRGISRFDGEVWHPHSMPPEFSLQREGGTLKQSDDGSLWVNQANRSWFFRKRPNFQITKALSEGFRTVRYRPDTDAPVVNILSYDDQTTSPANVLIEWEGMDKWCHTPSDQLRYSYRLGNEPWSEFDFATNTTLLDVPTGDYAFQVRSMDSDGNINVASVGVNFSVLAPLWKQPWYIALEILIVLIIIGLVYLLFKQRICQILQMEEFKIQFFTNMSHELRTPLTVILGPLESQLAQLPEGWNRRPLELAYKNAQKTLNLVDQILDFRSAETGKTKLNPTHCNIVETVGNAVDLIRPLTADKSQILKFKCETKESFLWCDSEKLERIVNNLLSNASKYTHEFGEISVTLKFADFPDSVNVQLIVEDNGSGIPQKSIGSIFNAFYRAGNVTNSNVRGFGIGLAYTKNLVEAFSGTISVESPIIHVNSVNQGSRFTVMLPLKKYIKKDSNDALMGDEDSSSILRSLDEDSAKSQSVVLIVEDDKDIREFIKSELETEYRMLSAEDGEAGLKLAKEVIPDLILTDVMMPKIDGKVLCREIKGDLLTCHIPVLMLTALKSEQHELEGLKIGADDYLTKPVSTPILKNRIQNQLESIRRQHARFERLDRESKTSPEKIAVNPLDERFLETLLEVIDERMEDPLFNVDMLASKMGTSRMTLYRKFKAITGQSPGSFIRSIRLKRAAELLRSGACNVTETAYRVGFGDVSSFSTSFKSQYKQSPKDYAQGNQSPVLNEASSNPPI